MLSKEIKLMQNNIVNMNGSTTHVLSVMQQNHRNRRVQTIQLGNQRLGLSLTWCHRALMTQIEDQNQICKSLTCLSNQHSYILSMTQTKRVYKLDKWIEKIRTAISPILVEVGIRGIPQIKVIWKLSGSTLEWIESFDRVDVQTMKLKVNNLLKTATTRAT